MPAKPTGQKRALDGPEDFAKKQRKTGPMAKLGENNDKVLKKGEVVD